MDAPAASPGSPFSAPPAVKCDHPATGGAPGSPNCRALLCLLLPQDAFALPHVSRFGHTHALHTPLLCPSLPLPLPASAGTARHPAWTRQTPALLLSPHSLRTLMMWWTPLLPSTLRIAASARSRHGAAGCRRACVLRAAGLPWAPQHACLRPCTSCALAAAPARVGMCPRGLPTPHGLPRGIPPPLTTPLYPGLPWSTDQPERAALCQLWIQGPLQHHHHSQVLRAGQVGAGVLRCAVLCCAVLCCAVLCCAVLCCAVLCCAVQCPAGPCSAARWPPHHRPPKPQGLGWWAGNALHDSCLCRIGLSSTCMQAGRQRGPYHTQALRKLKNAPRL